MILQYSKKTIQKFILSKQFLFPPRKISGAKGIEIIFNNLRIIQYDPQNPCGRSIDILLQARVKNIHPEDYYCWLYEERKGVEIYDKELSVVPIEDLSLCRGRFPLLRYEKLNRFLKENNRELQQLIRFIDKKGPTCSFDLSENKQVDIFWEPTRWSKAALDSLWKVGKLAISYRKNGRKYYDLSDKVYGNKFIEGAQGLKKKFRDEGVRRRIRSVGLLPASGTGAGWLGVGIGKEITTVILKLIKQKKLIEIEIEGVKSRYVVDVLDLDLFLNISKKNPSKKISFLSPLDNLLWDRKMIKDIFDFDYKWEAYTPASLRKFGHYVLPILYGSEFIGRIEPVYNKKDDVLEIKGFWLEPNYKWNVAVGEALTKYLEEFKKYLQTRNIKWFCKIPRKRR